MPADHGTPNAGDEHKTSLAEFQEGLTRALNRHGVPAMPSWDAAIDWLAEHGSTRSPQSYWECECGQRVEWKFGAWFCPTHRDSAVVHPVPVVPPSRDGTVAVEDVRAWLRRIEANDRSRLGGLVFEFEREFGVSERIHDQATKEEGRPA